MLVDRFTAGEADNGAGRVDVVRERERVEPAPVRKSKASRRNITNNKPEGSPMLDLPVLILLILVLLAQHSRL